MSLDACQMLIDGASRGQVEQWLRNVKRLSAEDAVAIVDQGIRDSCPRRG